MTIISFEIENTGDKDRCHEIEEESVSQAAPKKMKGGWRLVTKHALGRMHLRPETFRDGRPAAHSCIDIDNATRSCPDERRTPDDEAPRCQSRYAFQLTPLEAGADENRHADMPLM